MIGQSPARKPGRWLLITAAGSLLTSLPVLLIIVALIAAVSAVGSSYLSSAQQSAATAGGPGNTGATCDFTAPLPPMPGAPSTSAATATTAATTAKKTTPGVPPAGKYGAATLTDQQMRVAADIVAAAKPLHITSRGITLALIQAYSLSTFDPTNSDGPYVGLFLAGPNTTGDLSSAAGAAKAFYAHLKAVVPDYETSAHSDDELIAKLTETPHKVRNTDAAGVAKALTAVLVDGMDAAAAGFSCLAAGSGGSAVFDPGNIISDDVFYNVNTMNDEAVRQFIAAKNKDCKPATCLRSNQFPVSGYLQADAYCQGITRPNFQPDAAWIIYTVSVACRINPQVMLVTLEKESGLLTDTTGDPNRYRAAFGWFCPDTGPGGTANCDSTHAGFWNQAYGMAKQWARYRIDAAKYNYHAGQTVNILWNVAETNCGSAPVKIKNQATASLYDYTPYQPNAAALAAGLGREGDKCSAYGNRNFFLLFRKYFGDTGGGKPGATNAGAAGGNSNIVVNGVAIQIPNLGGDLDGGIGGQIIKAPNAAVARGLAAGFATLGMPYVWGGGTNNGPPDNGCARGGGSKNSCGSVIGLDCSGLTGYVLHVAGFTIPDNSGSQRSAGTSVPWSQGLPGDIIGFPGHVSMYLGTINGVEYQLEAPDVGIPIRVKQMFRTDQDPVLHRYWS